MSIFMLDIRLITRTFEGDKYINSNLLYDMVAQILKILSAMRETGFNPGSEIFPGGSMTTHGQRSLVAYSPQSHKESDKLSD